MAKKEKLSLEELLENALVKDEDKPYDVPSNWEWVRLGTISEYIQRGKSPKYSEIQQYPVISQKCIQWSGFEPSVVKFINPESIVTYGDERFIQFGDILWNSTGTGTIGRLNIYNGELDSYDKVVADSHITIVRIKKIYNRFVYYYLCSPRIQGDIENRANGTTNQIELNTSTVANQLIPLPPLLEQQRIVDLLESLFEKLDRARELVQNALDSFEERKSSILHKAFAGELTKKWRDKNNVTSCEEYFEIIKRQRLNIATQKEIKDITESFNLFNIEENKLTNGWIKLKAMMICDNITCGKTPSEKIASVGEVPFLKVYNIVNNKINFSYKPQFIDTETHNGKLKSSKLMPNDVVMNIVGPPLRKIAIIPNDYPEWNMNQAIVRFRIIEYVDNKFFYYSLINDETLDEVITETKGVVGQANISITQSRNLLIPIPSIEEQKEIVRILDNLLDNEEKVKELCDIIENIDHMKKSILARAFRGELATNNPNEESAFELLKEVLKERLESK